MPGWLNSKNFKNQTYPVCKVQAGDFSRPLQLSLQIRLYLHCRYRSTGPPSLPWFPLGRRSCHALLRLGSPGVVEVSIGFPLKPTC